MHIDAHIPKFVHAYKHEQMPIIDWHMRTFMLAYEQTRIRACMHASAYTSIYIYNIIYNIPYILYNIYYIIYIIYTM